MTEVLTETEKNIIVPAVCVILKNRIGAKNAIRNKDICRILADKGLVSSEARMRKVVNFIRRHGLVLYLVANSHGYFIAESVEAVERYADSLKDRATAIFAVRQKLLDQVNGVLFI